MPHLFLATGAALGVNTFLGQSITFFVGGINLGIARNFAALGADIAAVEEEAKGLLDELLIQGFIQVMVLGAYHFDNPGRDIHNAKVDVLDAAYKLPVGTSATQRFVDPSVPAFSPAGSTS